MDSSITALLSGPDNPGIVARVAGWIHDRGGTRLHADQHLDRQENVFSKESSGSRLKRRRSLMNRVLLSGWL